MVGCVSARRGGRQVAACFSARFYNGARSPHRGQGKIRCAWRQRELRRLKRVGLGGTWATAGIKLYQDPAEREDGRLEGARGRSAEDKWKAAGNCLQAPAVDQMFLCAWVGGQKFPPLLAGNIANPSPCRLGSQGAVAWQVTKLRQGGNSLRAPPCIAAFSPSFASPASSSDVRIERKAARCNGMCAARRGGSL